MTGKKRKKPHHFSKPTEDSLREAQFRREIERIKKLEGGTYHAATEPKRNDPCPCSSGKKYKNCCIGETAQYFLVVDPQTAEPWAPDGAILVFPSVQSAQRRALKLPFPAQVAGIGVSKWAAFKARFNGEGDNPGYVEYEKWRAEHEQDSTPAKLSPERKFAHEVMRRL